MFDGKSILLDFYERTRKPEDPFPPEVPSYLRLLTTVWVVYFLCKAVLYGYIAVAMPLERAIEIRSIIGPVSFLALLLGERVVRRPLFRALRDRGVLSVAAP